MMTIIGNSSSSSNQYIDIESGLIGNENSQKKNKIQPMSYLLTFYIVTLSMGEIILSYFISNSTSAENSTKDCDFFIKPNIWFIVQGILSITYVLFSYVIYYYRYKTNLLQKISYKINTQENYDLAKMLYYGFCLLYQFFMIIWIIFGTILLLMECSFIDNSILYNMGVTVLFLEYVTLISFIKMILSVHLIE